MKQTTDFQRQRVFEAQRTARRAGTFPELTDSSIAATLTTIVKSAWFRKQVAVPHVKGKNILGVLVEHAPQYTQCQVELRQMQRRTGATPAWWLVVTVGNGNRERSLPEVMHPLVHLITPTAVGNPHHHTQTFTKNMLAMVARFESVDAKKRLQAQYRASKVKFTVTTPEGTAARSAAMTHRRSKAVVVPDLLALRDELASS